VRPLVQEICQNYIAELREELNIMTAKGGSKPHLEPFKGEPQEDAEVWLSCFEQYSKVSKWENLEPVQWFPFFLQEGARSWYHALPEDSTKTWEDLSKAFKKRFQPHGAIKWARLDEFQARKQGSVESVDVFVEAISRMGRQLERSKDQIKESVIRGLRTPIRNAILLKDNSTKELDVIVEWAKQAEILAKAENESQQATLVQAIASMTAKMENFQSNMERKIEMIGRAGEIAQMQSQELSKGGGAGYPIQGRSNDRVQGSWQGQGHSQSNGNWSNNRQRQFSNTMGSGSAGEGAQCKKCGRYFSGSFSNHHCPAKDRICHGCNKVGHYQSMCFFKKQGVTHQQGPQ
jgi:hypothetical protein